MLNGTCIKTSNIQWQTHENCFSEDSYGELSVKKTLMPNFSQKFGILLWEKKRHTRFTELTCVQLNFHETVRDHFQKTKGLNFI